jgi:hypothetical protein
MTLHLGQLHPASSAEPLAIADAKERWAWLQRLLVRRPLNAAVVALPNKMARTI